MKKPSESSPLPETKWLDAKDFEYLCFDLTRELLSYSEPIPDYQTHDEALLHSALGSPKQTFDEKLLYPTLPDQAAILFYSLIKNHPFRNGNKRIALMAVLTFLSLNQKWLSVDPEVLYKEACDVSLSKSSDKDKILQRLNSFFADNLIKFPIPQE